MYLIFLMGFDKYERRLNQILGFELSSYFHLTVHVILKFEKNLSAVIT